MSEQDWSKVDNCIAWHLIERHADSWAEVGQMMDELVASRVEAAVLAEREKYEDVLSKIKSWSQAYPLSVFPEPDWQKAHEVLTANGMTLDAISASNMRHVITQVQAMVDAALGGE